MLASLRGAAATILTLDEIRETSASCPLRKPAADVEPRLSQITRSSLSSGTTSHTNVVLRLALLLCESADTSLRVTWRAES
jgi:hypothetical protein